MPTQLLTTKQLADRLGMGVATVLIMAKRGDIPSIRIGYRTVRFDWEAVLQALDPGPPAKKKSPAK
jgi:excisionase family DNA binding protein